jgi:hypothetical protein
VSGQGGQHLGLAAVPVRAGQHVVIAGGQHVGHLTGGQPGPERGVLAVGLVRGDPAGQHAGGVSALQHGQAQLRFGREPDLARDSSCGATVAVLSPDRR